MLFLFQTAAFPFSLDSGEMVFFPHFGKGLLRLGASAVCCNSAVDFPLNSFGIFGVRLSFGTDRRTKFQISVVFQKIIIDLRVGWLRTKGDFGSSQEVFSFVGSPPLEYADPKGIFEKYGEATGNFVHIGSS